MLHFSAEDWLTGCLTDKSKNKVYAGRVKKFLEYCFIFVFRVVHADEKWPRIPYTALLNFEWVKRHAG